MAETDEGISDKRLVVRGVGGLLLAVLLMFFFSQLPARNFWVKPAVVLAMFAAAVVVHELGHAVAAVVLRFRVLAVSVAPLRACMENGRFRIRWNRDRILAGFVAALPRTPIRLRARYFCFVLAGPVASFLIGIVGIVIGVMRPGTPSGQWALDSGLVSLCLGALSLPANRLYVSDGARLRMLWQNGAAADRLCALLLLATAASNGIRPREWDEALMRTAMGPSDSSLECTAAEILSYEAALDRGLMEDAAKHLATAIEGRERCPVTLQAGMALDAAFFQGAIRGDAALARQWFEQCNPKLVDDKYSVFLAEAAVLLAEGNFTEACARADECRKALPEARYPGFAKASEDWARLLLRRAQAQMTATTSE